MNLARLVVLALLGTGIAGAVFAVPLEGRYTDTKHRFSLLPPPGWTVNQNLIPHYAVLVEPQARPEEEAATIGTYGEPVHVMTLEAYVKSTRAEIAKQKGLTVYGEKKITLGGEPAYSWRMHVNVPGQAAHENRQVVCLRGPQALTLTLTTLPEAMKKYDAMFDKVVASFQWEPGAVVMPGTSIYAGKPKSGRNPQPIKLPTNTNKDTSKKPTQKRKLNSDY